MEQQTQRDRIKGAARDRKPVPVEVPEWGETVHVRVMPSVDVLHITEADTPQRELVYTFLIDCLLDDDGAALFTDEDRGFLEQEPFSLILRLFNDAAKINGLPTGALDEAMEGLQPTPDAASSTG